MIQDDQWHEDDLMSNKSLAVLTCEQAAHNLLITDYSEAGVRRFRCGINSRATCFALASNGCLWNFIK